MMRSIQRLLYFLSIVLLFSNCRKKEWDEYYGRPDSLANPIYQQLSERGNFKNFLSLVDKSGYKETLSSAGLWTIFAPNDSAFTSFLKSSGYAAVNDLPDTLVNQIVRYSLVYDAYNSKRLPDYFSVKGFIENAAFRRRTTFYDFVYDAKNGNTSIKAIAGNRNTGTFDPNDFNNKFIPYFFSEYFGNNGLSSVDYNYFFPSIPFSGANVLDANIVEKDIVAENGIIHVVDKVILPPPSIDQYIASTNNYSEFRKLLNMFVTYAYDKDVTHKYQVLKGGIDSVYRKIYSSQLAFSPNNETYVLEDNNDGQTGSYSIVVPKDDVVKAYEKSTLLKYYPRGTTMEQLFKLNSDIIRDFINSHMYRGPLWPSQMNRTANFLSEESKLNAGTDISDKKVLSNGFFYGTTKVQEPGVFTSVYGNVYLDPKYSIMKRAMDYYGYSLTIKNTKLKYSIIPISDNVLTAMGFSYNDFYPSAPIRLNGNADNTVLKRILESHIIPTSGGELNNISGSGIVETWGGEYIRYNKGRFYSSGTYDSTDVARRSVRVDSSAKADNGYVHYASGVLSYTNNNPAQDILDSAATASSPYYYFFKYLEGSTALYNTTTKEIQGVSLGLNYTFFIPTNAAILQAVKDKVLPGTVSGTVVTPNFNPTDGNDISNVIKFIQYHIVSKNTIATDGKKTGFYATVLKNSLGDPTSVYISYDSSGKMIVTDMNGNKVNVIMAQSNVLSNRTLIHQIDNYLKYTY